MAFIRNCVTTAVTVLCILVNTKAQTVYYPAGSSQLLKTTAEDAAMLLQKAVTGSKFSTQAYTTMPQTGIVFIYDTTITDNQACKTKSNGIDNITLSAYGDNGLHFGIYQYLHQLGYRFYQPGTAWEIIPTLSSAYKKLDTVYTCSYKYKTWYVSGGYNRWIMDNAAANDWGIYQRRNGMMGSSGFAGHRGDLMSGNYFTTLKNNPCYIANFNGFRQANSQSVPDINNTSAKELWANTIEQKYTQYKNVIYSNPALYANIYRNFNYSYNYIGIEVPDGAQWGNSKNSDDCGGTGYPKESDQHFALANFTAQKILEKYPDKHFQLYAYSSHADVPSPAVTINKSIDIQLIPTVYQLESSTNGLRNRWYNRSSSISEYHYLNLSGWTGETPSFNWGDLKATLQIAKDKKSQGIMWEASPAKFGSLPFLLAANNYLKDNKEVDNTLHEFCDNMFADANSTIFKLLQMWGQENTAPGKYNIQLYLQLLNTAVQQTLNAPEVVKERLRELKAYLHYMVMVYDLTGNDQNKAITRAEKDAALCIYIAKTNRLQLINSYYMIAVITGNYPAASNFNAKYNIVNGTAYQNGNLPLITAAEIDDNFIQDLSSFGNQIEQFKLEEAAYIKQQFKAGNIAPLSKIKTFIGYTNGANYYGKTTFNIIAPAAGNFTIQYIPRFDMPDKGYINFLVESEDKVLQIVKDFSIDNTAKEGTITINLPSAGKYVFTIASKYKSAADLSIITNGNYFYKNGKFLGTMMENYRADLSNLPGYFYIPNGLNKVYFNISNCFSNGKYASASAIANTFGIKDNNGNLVQFHLASAKDSSLFYLEIPAGAAGNFWQVTQMAGYNLQFVNISNVLWYAERKACAGANFTITLINKNSNCFTRVSTTASAASLTWEVNDKGRISKYSNQAIVDLPDYISPNAVITLTNGEGCSFTKALANDEKYLRAKEACASGAAIAEPTVSPVLYPNPSTGIFNCMKDENSTTVNEIVIYNTQGNKVANFKNVKQFNISNVTSGLYFYQMVINGIVYKGRVMKL
jgi:Secretion system C-terminal sorting domain